MSIEADPPVVAERQTATFTVELSGTVSDADVTLPYSIGASATTDDYTRPAEQTVVIPAGEMSATISIPIVNDGQDEVPDETLSVTLQGDGLPEGVVIQTATDSVRITDHEIRASVGADQDTVTEGSAVVFTVALRVGGTAAGDRNRSGVEVQYAVGGDVTAQDYSGASAGTLTIAPDQSEATITITTRDDDGLDRGETLTLSLTDATSLQNQGLADCESDGRRGFYHDCGLMEAR